MTNPIKIVICATQRSGSTLVCEDIRNNGLGKAEEHFLTVIGGSDLPDPRKALQRIATAGTDANGAFAVKIMASYADRIERVLSDGAAPAADGPLWPSIHEAYRDALWVHIDRRAIIRQAASRLMSKRTGLNHALASGGSAFVPGNSRVGYEADYNRNVEYSQLEMDEFVLEIVRERHRWEQFFTDHGIEPIRLIYEEFVKDPDYIGEIRAALGLPAAGINASRNLVKLANDRNEEMVRDYAASTGRVKRPLAAARPAAGGPKPQSATVTDIRPSAPSGGGSDEALKSEVATVARRWAATPYYDSNEPYAINQWKTLITPFLKSAEIDYSSVLELAVGHGRMTAILLPEAGHLTGVDTLQENIDFCAERFKDAKNLTLLRNDGIGLSGVPSDSISFVFCFDSMVHFDSDVVRRYLAEFRRVMKPGAYGFVHHSNLDRNPGGDFQRAAHARNFMTERLFRHYAAKEGLSVVKSRIIDWGLGEKLVPGLDSFALLRRPA